MHVPNIVSWSGELLDRIASEGAQLHRQIRCCWVRHVPRVNRGERKAIVAVRLAVLLLFPLIQAAIDPLYALEVERGRTFYVDAIYGDDANNGLTPESAWRSVEKLVKHNAQFGFSACESILFRRGATYYSSVGLQFNGSGTAECPITIGAYGDGEPPLLIAGGPALKSWRPVGRNVWLWPYAGREVKGLWEDARALRKASDEALSDGAWYFKKGVGVFYRPGSDSPHTQVVHRATPGNALAFDGNAHIVIRGLHFRILGIYLSPRKSEIRDISIENNTFEHIKTPIEIFSRMDGQVSDIRIKENRMRKVGYGVRVHAGNGVARTLRLNISGNVMEDIDAEQIYTSWSDGFYDNEAISLQNLNDSEVSGNSVSGGGALGGGIVQWTNPQSTAHGNRFQGNFICNITGPGFALFNSGHEGIHRQNNVQNNIVCNLAPHNLLSFQPRGKDEGMGGLRLNGRDASYSNKAYNNTIIGYDHNIFLNSIAIGWVLKNNLSALQSASHVWRREGRLNGALMDYNLYSPMKDGALRLGRGLEPKTLRGWQASGADRNSIEAEPLLENSSGAYGNPRDFAPRWDSPLIDAGDVTDTEEDFFGNPIYGPRDIGAVEYQPPYQMGINPIDVAGNARVYGDGRFRYTRPLSGVTVPLAILSVGNNTREWVDVRITDWHGSLTWIESSSNITGALVRRVGGLAPSTKYRVVYAECSVAPRVLGVFDTDESGLLSFIFEKAMGMGDVAFTVAPEGMAIPNVARKCG